MSTGSLCQKLRRIFTNLFGGKSPLGQSKIYLLSSLLLIFPFQSLYNHSLQADVGDDGVTFEVALEEAFVESGDSATVNIIIQNDNDNELNIDEIVFLASPDVDVVNGVNVSAHSSFRDEYVIPELSVHQTKVTFIMNYKLAGSANQSSKIAFEDISVRNKFNFDAAPFLITLILGMLSGVITSEASKYLSDKRTYKKDEKEKKLVAIHKAISFFIWSEKVAEDPSLAENTIWEKVFLESDTLLYLQRASNSGKETNGMSKLVLGTMDLLLKIDKLIERTKHDDRYSNATKNLEREIEMLALDLKKMAENIK
jgi:hypothetical protein